MQQSRSTIRAIFATFVRSVISHYSTDNVYPTQTAEAGSTLVRPAGFSPTAGKLLRNEVLFWLSSIFFLLGLAVGVNLRRGSQFFVVLPSEPSSGNLKILVTPEDLEEEKNCCALCGKEVPEDGDQQEGWLSVLYASESREDLCFCSDSCHEQFILYGLPEK